MKAPYSSPDPGSRRVLWVMVVLSMIILAVSIYLIAKNAIAPEETSPGEPSPFEIKNRSGYQNRGVWRGATGAQRTASHIRGTVYEKSGNVLVGASVTASTFVVSGNLSSPAAQVETDSAGRFDLIVPEGSYYLNAEQEGFGPAMVIAHSGDEISLVLPKSGAIIGHVKDTQGRPITRFAIDVLSPSTDDMAAPTPFVSRSFASEDGSYKLEELPERLIFLRVTAGDLAPAFSDMLGIAPDETRTVDFQVSAGCTLTGTVKDESGKPLMDVFVDAELRKTAGAIGTSSIDAASVGESDMDGRFSLPNVPLGQVMVRAYDGSHAVSTASVDIKSCDAIPQVELTMGSGSVLTGLVHDTAGEPLAGVKLALSHRAIGFVNTTTNSEGRYSVSKLPPGNVRIIAMRGEHRTAALVTIPEGQTVEKDIPFKTEGTGEISGRILANGKPLQGMQLTIISNEGGGILGERHPVTGPDGSYRATGLPDGAYAVLVASVNRVASARIEEGSSETVDIDINQAPERLPAPKLPAKVDNEQGGDEPE